MNASEMTFGVEIETIAPYSLVSSGRLSIGSYHHGTQVSYLPQGWKAECDGSLEAGPTGGYACEIVSPVLKGEAGLREVAKVIAILKEQGHRVNASCGVHVHVGWKYDTCSSKLARLIQITSYAERGIYAATGTKNRENGIRGRRFCKGLRSYGKASEAKKFADRDRYHLLNLSNLASYTRPTVEFRAFSGSLNATKITTWVQLCLGLVEQAHLAKRSPSWAPTEPKGGWKKAGPGQSEVERLMGYLGWGEGYAKRQGGRMAGWLLTRSEMDTAKDTLRRLAKKYDGESTAAA